MRRISPFVTFREKGLHVAYLPALTRLTSPGPGGVRQGPRFKVIPDPRTLLFRDRQTPGVTPNLTPPLQGPERGRGGIRREKLDDQFAPKPHHHRPARNVVLRWRPAGAIPGRRHKQYRPAGLVSAEPGGGREHGVLPGVRPHDRVGAVEERRDNDGAGGGH